MTNKKIGQRLRQLLAMMGSDNVNEREIARQKIDDILVKNRMTWNDLIELMAVGQHPAPGGPAEDAEEAVYDDERTAEQTTDDAIKAGLPIKSAKPPNVLDLTRYILMKYVELKEHEYIVVALWLLHTYCFNRFTITPRLAILSPVNGCGKTTLLAVIEKLAYRPQRMDHTTAAVVFHMIDRTSCTLLVDEADNLGLNVNGTLRSIFNSGHRQGGNVRRFMGGAPRAYRTYAPLAIAAIGNLPRPLMRRAIIVPMEKSIAGNIKRFDLGDPKTRGELDIVYRLVLEWERSKPALDLNPPIPKELHNRVADNWRPLIAIADSFGPYWAQRAREAAVTIARTYHDEDAGVTLLSDLRDIFNRTGADRMTSDDLITALLDIEESGWSEYRGVRDDQAARKLTQGEMARLLRPFNITPRSIWPLGKQRQSVGSRKGYYRAQCEQAWQRYCPAEETSEQKAKAIGTKKAKPKTIRKKKKVSLICAGVPVCRVWRYGPGAVGGGWGGNAELHRRHTGTAAQSARFGRGLPRSAAQRHAAAIARALGLPPRYPGPAQIPLVRLCHPAGRPRERPWHTGSARGTGKMPYLERMRNKVQGAKLRDTSGLAQCGVVLFHIDWLYVSRSGQCRSNEWPPAGLAS